MELQQWTEQVSSKAMEWIFCAMERIVGNGLEIILTHKILLVDESPNVGVYLQYISE